MKRSTMLIGILMLILAGCGSVSESVKKTGSSSFNRMMRDIDALVNDEVFSHAHWGVLIKSLDKDEVWYSQNAERLFMPASNNKIPSTALALKVLGPEFRFETHVISKGAITDGVLNGDLVVWSNGDPTMYERYLGDSRAVFHAWADTLKAQGIRRINGNIIGDDNAFDEEYMGEGWAWDYLQVWYAAQFGALQFNENYVDVKIVAPADMNGSVELIPNCPSSYYTLINEIELVQDGPNRISMDRAPNSNVITFSGQVRAGADTLERTPTIHNPTKFYVHVLTEVLREKGIAVSGKALDCDELPQWKHAPLDPRYTELAHYYSVPLSEAAARLMKRSQNMYAETMPRVTAWKQTGLGSMDAARTIMDSVCAGFGIEPGSWVYADGSGLTRYDYISPRIIIKILEGMYNSEHKDVWMSAFPVAGVDGTLKNRMKGSPAEGRVLGKTGTIANVRGLSGYTQTAAGETIAYSFLVNGHLVNDAETERITDSILKLICSYK
ncbi:MAG: D-alanyl-D-alanine carboxypeptidase/D-alanyl-D-alanine-endopeptidase [Candidatus Marinimicrobia bacterium]|nr:D-alanyl-D-alanine carboxypeptidase/D-alanyl-D-alanine-endopeptidase [Candidatus Neomarinimicrobiota bacterium]